MIAEYHTNERLAREQEQQKDADEDHNIIAEIDAMMCDPMLESIAESMAMAPPESSMEHDDVQVAATSSSSSSSSSTPMPKAKAKAAAKAAATSRIAHNTRAAKKAKLQ